MKSYKTTPPSFKTVLQHPWLWISTFFGSGCITPAPGTWGSFAAWGVFLLLDMWLGRSFMGCGIGYICPRVRLGGQEYGLFK